MDEIITEHELLINTPVEMSGFLEKEMEDVEQYQQEKTLEDCEIDEDRRPTKRNRAEDEEGWTEVRGSKGKKIYKREEIEIYISSQEKMPKQFALAKIFKEEGIKNIEKIRYINPYKIRVDMKNEDSVEVLEKSKKIIERGWRVQRAMEVNFSYGVIRDIEIDLTEDEMLKRIECTEPAQLISVQRLMRRNSEGEGWKPSESVRLCFKGSFRPAFITVDGLRIRVEQYIFPETQCSRCWKLGHSAQRCPSTKVICPKCSDNHNNCETTSFKCPNCNGQHMALVRSCPSYLKEKRLREIMAEFNCTYRRALTMYVPVKETKLVDGLTTTTEQNDRWNSQDGRLSFSAVIQKPLVEVTAQQSKEDILYKTAKKPQTKPHKPKQTEKPIEYETWIQVDAMDSQELAEEDESKKTREVQFSELINRLKEILFLKGETIQQKVQSCIKCCVQWVILVLVENISDWPILKLILDYFGLNE